MPDQWTCKVCGHKAPIQPMARECEAKHEEQGDAKSSSSLPR